MSFSVDNYFVGISPTFENPPMNRTSILSFERIVTCSTILLINMSSNSVNSTISNAGSNFHTQDPSSGKDPVRFPSFHLPACRYPH